jgi:hypothetical protein
MDREVQVLLRDKVKLIDYIREIQPFISEVDKAKNTQIQIFANGISLVLDTIYRLRENSADSVLRDVEMRFSREVTRAVNINTPLVARASRLRLMYQYLDGIGRYPSQIPVSRDVCILKDQTKKLNVALRSIVRGKHKALENLCSNMSMSVSFSFKRTKAASNSSEVSGMISFRNACSRLTASNRGLEYRLP